MRNKPFMSPDDWDEFGRQFGEAIQHLVDGDAEYFFNWADPYINGAFYNATDD